jgi:hypothetical protein
MPTPAALLAKFTKLDEMLSECSPERNERAFGPGALVSGTGIVLGEVSYCNLGLLSLPRLRAAIRARKEIH